MSNVRRVYVEKKPAYAVQAKELKHEIRSYLGIDNMTGVRVLIRYDVENISDEVFANSQTELNKFMTAHKMASLKLALKDYHNDRLNDELYGRYIEAMSDDLNTPNAYSVIFETVKALNGAIRVKEIDYDNLAALNNTLEKELDILGIAYKNVSLSDEDKEIYHKWEEAKKAKDFTAADEMREKLMERGIL